MMKCPVCGSENIMDGKLVSYGAVGFVEKSTELLFEYSK